MDFIPPQMPTEVEQYLSLYDDLFSRPEMREHFRYYIAGLISETNHKNIFQIMSKVIEGNYQSGHHFFSHSPWPTEMLNLRRLDLWQRDPLTRISLSGWWIQDDTGQVRRLRGKANPENENRLSGGTDGVARQYIGNVGKISEGLVFVSTHYADLAKRLPLVADLYWPEAARIRLPEEELTPKRVRSKIAIALDQLSFINENDNMRGPKPRQVVADSWYGSSPDYLNSIEKELKWRYVVAIRPNRRIFTRLPGDRGQPEHSAEEVTRHLKTDQYRKVSVRLSGGKPQVKYVVEVTKLQQVKVKGLNHRPKLFISVDDPAQRDPEQTEYLLSNDKQISAGEVVQAYSLRNWEEVFYRQGKDWLGLDECEAHLEERLLRHWVLVMVSWTMVETMRLRGDLRERSQKDRHTFEAEMRLLQDVFRWEFWTKWIKEEENVKRFVEWMCGSRGLEVSFEAR